MSDKEKIEDLSEAQKSLKSFFGGSRKFREEVAALLGRLQEFENESFWTMEPKEKLMVRYIKTGKGIK